MTLPAPRLAIPGLLAALLLPATPAAAAQTAIPFHLVAPPTPPGARLMGFTLTLIGARVSAFPDCPPSWELTISNDPARHATVRAHAVVGAAALDPVTLETMILVEPGLETPAIASGSVTVLRRGRLSTRPVPRFALLPVPSQLQTHP